MALGGAGGITGNGRNASPSSRESTELQHPALTAQAPVGRSSSFQYSYAETAPLLLLDCTPVSPYFSTAILSRNPPIYPISLSVLDTKYLYFDYKNFIKQARCVQSPEILVLKTNLQHLITFWHKPSSNCGSFPQGLSLKLFANKMAQDVTCPKAEECFYSPGFSSTPHSF